MRMEQNNMDNSRVLVNKETGAAYPLPKEPNYEYFSDIGFWKASPAFFDKLHGMTAPISKVTAVVLKNVKALTNKVKLSYQKVVRESGCDKETVKKAIAYLEQQDIVVNIQKPETRKNGEWMLNPRLLAKGTDNDQKELTGQYDEYKRKTTSHLCIVDKSTGESYSLPIDISIAEMQDNYSKDFWKLYKPFFDAMAGLGRAENEVFIYILENFDWASNTLDAPQQVIAKNSGTSKASVERTIRTLKEKDFMTCLGGSCWMVNPDVVMRGGKSKYHQLRNDYKKGKKDAEQRKNEREQKKAGKKANLQSKNSAQEIPQVKIPPYIPQQLVSAPEVSAPEPPMSQKIPIPGGGLWPPKKEEKPQQNKFVPFIPAFMQKQMAEEERKRKEEMSQESVEDIAISAVPYDDGESDEYIPLEYVEAGAATWDDGDEATYVKDDDDLPF